MCINQKLAKQGKDSDSERESEREEALATN